MRSDDFFGGAPSLSWARQDANGEWVDIPELLNVIRGGVVTAVGEPVQMTEMGTGKPLWWKEPTTAKPEGEPKLKLIITVRCDGSGRGIDERNPGDPSDIGERQLHVQSKDMRTAIAAACRKVGARGPAIGSELYVAWTGKRASRIKNAKAARTWAALYVPHQVDLSDDGRGSTGANPFGAQAPVQPAAPAIPAQQSQLQTPAPQQVPVQPAAPAPWEQQTSAVQPPPATAAPWDDTPRQPAASANPFG